MLDKVLTSEEYRILRTYQDRCTRMLMVMSVFWALIISIILFSIHFRNVGNFGDTKISTIFVFACELTMVFLFFGYDLFCLHSDREYRPINIYSGTVIKKFEANEASMGSGNNLYLVDIGEKQIPCQSVSQEIKYDEGEKVIIWNGKGWDKEYYLCLQERESLVPATPPNHAKVC